MPNPTKTDRGSRSRVNDEPQQSFSTDACKTAVAETYKVARESVASHPVTATMTSFAIGLGIGLGLTLAFGSAHQTPERTFRDSFERLFERARNAWPTST